MARHRAHHPGRRRPALSHRFLLARLVTATGVAGLLVLLFVLGGGSAPRRLPSPTLRVAAADLTLTSLSAVVNGTTVTASTTISSDRPVTLDQIGVCVRGPGGRNVDYPEDHAVRLTPSAPVTFVRTASFPAGVYSYFGCVFYQGAWQGFGRSAFTTPGTTPGQRGTAASQVSTATSTTSASTAAATSTAPPSQARAGSTSTGNTSPRTSTSNRTTSSGTSSTGTSSAGTYATDVSTTTTSPPPTDPSGAAPAGGPAAGMTLAFADEFDRNSVGSTWGYTTSAYAYGDHNPGDHKLDWTTPSAMSVANGVLTMTATPRGDGYWNTGLLTTEPSSTGGNGFTVQAGDFLVNHVRMPSGNTGAWPALWTWLNGNGEVDAFEWHTDNPNLLELSNHIRSGSSYYSNSSLVSPGQWVWIGVKLGTNNDTWYVGSTLDSMQAVYSDGSGIGSTRPYIIADLAVSDGSYHPAPSGSAAISYAIDAVRDYR